MTAIFQALGFSLLLGVALIGVSLMAFTLTLIVASLRSLKSNTATLPRRIANSGASTLLFWLGYFLLIFGLFGLWSL